MIEGDNFLDSQEIRIPAGVKFKTLLDWLSDFTQLVDRKIDVACELNGRFDYEVVGKFQCQVRVVGRTHDLVQLFAWANADELVG